MPTTKKTQAEVVEAAVESFDVADWLSAGTTPNDSVTIYRDGEALLNLRKLEEYVDRMAAQSEEERAQDVSAITDDPEELDANVKAEIVAMQERLAANSLTFHLVGITPKEADLIDKRVARSNKDNEDANGKKGGDHEDFGEWLAEAYLSRMIVDTTMHDGTSVKKSWTPEEIHSLRFDEKTSKGLPGREFGRLEKKAVDMIYMRYDVDKIIDQDFS